MSWPDWTELTELIKALGALLWPIAILILIFVFQKEARGLVRGRKLKKGKLFGQEFELEEDLNRLDQTTKGLAETPLVASLPAGPQPTQPAGPSPADIQQQVYDVTRQVLTEAGSSPKAALMLLAA